MKIIDATWEKRNIGVKTAEVIIEESDSVENYEEKKDVLAQYEYVVIKVPVNMPAIVDRIQEEGYRFIESAIMMFKNVSQFSMPNGLRALYNLCRIDEMNVDDLNDLFIQIGKGIFKTDRIALDSFFSKEAASERYINWLKDMIEVGKKCYKVLYQGETIGFFIFDKKDNGEYHGILSGVYDRYSNLGLGMIVAIAETELIKKNGGTSYFTHFSSNNLPNIRLHERLGFIIEKSFNVFVRHGERISVTDFDHFEHCK